MDEALSAAALPVDGLFLKKNEAGGRVGEETSFALLKHWQSIAEREGCAELPFWIQGGIGPNSASASVIGGAAGVVLDNQLLLTRESPLSADQRAVASF